MTQASTHTPAPTMEHAGGIQIPAEGRAKLDEMRNAMILNVAQGNHPSFEHMVANLFKNMGDPVDTFLHATLGMSGEAGELLDAVKKTWVYGKPLDGKNIIEELSDLRFYYQAALLILGMDDLHIQAFNMDKLVLGENARYKTGFYSDAQAVARADKAAEELCIDEGCPHHGTEHVCRNSVANSELHAEATTGYGAAAEAVAAKAPRAKVFTANTLGGINWAWQQVGQLYLNESGFDSYASARMAAEAAGYEVVN